MTRIGIFGYGNLGRGIEAAIRQNKDMELCAVFTRRDPATLKIKTEGVVVARAEDVASTGRRGRRPLRGGGWRGEVRGAPAETGTARCGMVSRLYDTSFLHVLYSAPSQYIIFPCITFHPSIYLKWRTK